MLGGGWTQHPDAHGYQISDDDISHGDVMQGVTYRTG